MAPAHLAIGHKKSNTGAFLRPLNDNPHSLVDTNKLIKDWCVSPNPMTGYSFPVTVNILSFTQTLYYDTRCSFLFLSQEINFLSQEILFISQEKILL